MRARTWLIVAVALAAVIGAAVAAQAASRGTARPSTLHLVLPVEGAHAQFFDFDQDGLTFGDRLASRGPILDPLNHRQVGTAYGDCQVVTPKLGAAGTYWCRYILDLAQGNVDVEGLDPHGVSDVLFSVTGGTLEYRDAGGEAEFVDSATQTDIYLDVTSG